MPGSRKRAMISADGSVVTTRRNHSGKRSTEDARKSAKSVPAAMADSSRASMTNSQEDSGAGFEPRLRHGSAIHSRNMVEGSSELGGDSASIFRRSSGICAASWYTTVRIHVAGRHESTFERLQKWMPRTAGHVVICAASALLQI